MNQELLNEIALLKEKIKIVITLYEEEKNKSKVLFEAKEKLSSQAKEHEQEVEQLKQKYEMLKMAKTIAASSSDSHEAKLKVNKIVREIDKCIALLNK